jgi:putative ABC transport system substrate-binding protein
MAIHIRRRELIVALGGVAWPLAARAQQSERMRHIAVFMPTVANDPESMRRVAALLQGLQQMGWTDGRNVRIEFRWGAGDAEQYRKIAAELMALAPDVVVAEGTLTTRALQRASRTVPIVFVTVADPVGGGIVQSLAQPGDRSLANARGSHAGSRKHHGACKLRRDPDSGVVACDGATTVRNRRWW